MGAGLNYDSRDQSNSRIGSGTITPDTLKSDPTKRIRAKRSKAQMTLDSTTPLLTTSHRTIDFHTYGSEEASMPLPLLCVNQS
jgi:putative membrane protein